LEKMYGECFDNFRRQLEDGMSRKKICSIVLFFQQHRINITLDSFAENQVDIRITSPLVNSILRMQNPKSIVVLCEALNYPVPEIYFQKPEEVPKVDSEMNEKTEQKKTRKKRPPSHHTHKKEKKKKSLFTRILGL